MMANVFLCYEIIFARTHRFGWLAVINVILYKELNYVMSKTKTYCTNKVVLRIDYNCDNKIKISIVGQMLFDMMYYVVT